MVPPATSNAPAVVPSSPITFPIVTVVISSAAAVSMSKFKAKIALWNVVSVLSSKATSLTLLSSAPTVPVIVTKPPVFPFSTKPCSLVVEVIAVTPVNYKNLEKKNVVVQCTPAEIYMYKTSITNNRTFTRPQPLGL